MSDKNFVGPMIARIIGVILFLALLATAGYMAYQTGVAHGISQAPEVALAIQQAAENGQGAPMPYRYGYSHPFHHGFGPHFGFFPLGFCFSILLVFLFFGMLRFIFRPWAWHKRGHHRHHWEDRMNEWHKRAHGEESTQENK